GGGKPLRRERPRRCALAHHQPSPSLPRLEYEHAEHVADPLRDGAGDLIILERGSPRALLVADDGALLIRRRNREGALDLFGQENAAVCERARLLEAAHESEDARRR